MLKLGFKKQFIVECYNPDGSLAWKDGFENEVPTEGLNDVLAKYLKGSAYTAAWYLGLVNNSGFAAFLPSDTAAQIGGTNGWTEFTGYSNATRQATLYGTAAGGVLSTSAPTSVSINASGTLYGGFLISNSTKGGTSGVLFGEGAFLLPRLVASGQTLFVTVIVTAVSL